MTITKRDGMFVVRLELGKDAQGRRIQDYRRFKTAKEAKRYEALVLARLEEGKPGNYSAQPYKEYIQDRYLPAIAGRGLRPTTLEGYERLFRLHILPELGHVKLKDLTTLMLDELYARLLQKPVGCLGRHGDTLSPHTVAHAHNLISMSLVAAVKWDLIPKNVSALATPPRKYSWHKELQAWTEKEVVLWLAWLNEQENRLNALWFLLLTTGLRRGEALALRWSDVDQTNATVSVRRSLAIVGGKELRFQSTKTAKGLRTLKVGSDLLRVLNLHARRQKLERWAAGDRWHDEDLIFSQRDGSPLKPNRVSDYFARLLDRAIQEGVPVRGITLHGLRHTFVTLQVTGGVHSRIIQERAGHYSSAYTVDIYGHVDVGAQGDAAHVVQDLLRGVPLRQVQGGASAGEQGPEEDVSKR